MYVHHVCAPCIHSRLAKLARRFEHESSQDPAPQALLRKRLHGHVADFLNYRRDKDKVYYFENAINM